MSWTHKPKLAPKQTALGFEALSHWADLPSHVSAGSGDDAARNPRGHRVHVDATRASCLGREAVGDLRARVSRGCSPPRARRNGLCDGTSSSVSTRRAFSSARATSSNSDGLPAAQTVAGMPRSTCSVHATSTCWPTGSTCPSTKSIEVTASRSSDEEIEATCRLGGLAVRLRAAYGAPTSYALVLCGSDSPAAARLAPSCTPSNLSALYGQDALTRQYSAFHDRLNGLDSPIADGLAGSAAVRRALAILRTL